MRDRIDHPQPDMTGAFVTDLSTIAPGCSADGTALGASEWHGASGDDPNAQLSHFVSGDGPDDPQAFWTFLTAGGTALENGILTERTPLFDWVSVSGFRSRLAFG